MPHQISSWSIKTSKHELSRLFYNLQLRSSSLKWYKMVEVSGTDRHGRYEKNWVQQFSRNVLRKRFWHTNWTDGSLAGQSDKHNHLKKLVYWSKQTSMSSLFFSRGASRMFRRVKLSLSISNCEPVNSSIRFQWRCFMALLAINSSSGTISLKSSIFFLSSSAAGQSFSAFGSFRHLV